MSGLMTALFGTFPNTDDVVEPTVTAIEDPREGIVSVRVEVILRGRYYSEVGSAKCARNDQYDQHTGYLLAAGRAFRQIGRNMLSEGHSAVHAADKERERREAARAAAEVARQERARGRSRVANVHSSVTGDDD